MFFGGSKERRSRYNRVRDLSDYSEITQCVVLTFALELFNANPRLSNAVNVLLPTPPFPESTRILCFTCCSRSCTNWIPGSGPFVAPEEQSCWLGQPAHADAFPASSLCVPGQSIFYI